MKVSVVVGLLIHVSQHALAVVVQAYEGMESVLLPYQYSDILPDDPSVVWKRSDLNQTVIHLLKYDSGKLKEEYRHSEHMSMKKNILETGDFSLTVKKPQLSDSSNYTCNLQWEDRWEGPRERRMTEVQLQVKDDQEEVEVREGAESIRLPCKASADLPEDTTVDWTHFDPEPMVVHVSRSKTDDLQTQDRSYRDRTQMNEDMSLTLKKPTDTDGGVYICTVYREGDVLRSKVLLQVVPEGFPAWATALLVVFAVLLLILLGLSYKFRGYFLSVQQVEVDSGEESVLLPWKTTLHIEDVSQLTVEWTVYKNRKVHVYEDGSDRTNEQDDEYRNRTEMKEDPLRTGDLSLTLKHPTDQDTHIYTCTVYNREKEILRRKRVELKVKVQQVEVDSEEESVLLPWKTTLHIEDVSQLTVEWTDCKDMKVHVYEDGSDRTNEQDDEFRNRTEMKEDPLRTGDLSLTLKHPTDQDTHIYTCTVYNREKEILRRKRVELWVTGQQVEVEEGAWSALLPFRTTPDLPQDTTVGWRYRTNDLELIHVHVSEKKSAQPDEQNYRYRNRTKMNEDPWTTGDFSLTLKYPQQDDSGRYLCLVSRDEVILRRKAVRLKVKGQSSGAGQRSRVSLSSVSSADRTQVTYQFPPISSDAEAEAAV
ncbi:uncharacterized protein LOC115435069 [Sphaeramia orbicularis]|uniref:uncharacterized protein LOC115435069 n=1 Tax=Sphaeramia orbicularis TaxID=375764 RepID=UPI00117FEF25|nr:uncharacterized protein LOC115435069 [Sphaeramia orbicularis]